MYRQLFINGGWRDGSDGARIEVDDPATGEIIAEVAGGTPADALDACDAAASAQKSWANVAPRERSEILRSCWHTLIDHSDELASLIVSEHGKPLADAKGEITYAAEFFRWNAEET
ncbi:MAG TPA: aldehyde dehydrogenase family protein, partial [Ilumatobacter sp.]|nr:aldehyde dehydrogenase family protein [Ilumatobacter sp.]